MRNAGSRSSICEKDQNQGLKKTGEYRDHEKSSKIRGQFLASAQQFKKVAEIVHAEASRRYVVPSAPGKRFRKDTKVTDMLYGCYALAEQDEDFSENLHQIEERYQEIIDGLSLTLSLADEFAVIEKTSALMPERIMRHPAESI